jgi:cytoskeletal protein CcmA (bactofilin family)
MWKKEDVKTQQVPPVSPISATPVQSTPAPSVAPVSSQASPSPLPVSSRAAACISQGIKIKGEVTGSEDLFVDGNVDGKLNLANGSVTIGPNGNVKADVNAREVIVRGHVEGKVTGREKVQLWSTGRVTGEVQTERLAIEEGAVLRGKVEAGKPPSKPAEVKSATATGSARTSDSASLSSGTAAD